MPDILEIVSTAASGSEGADKNRPCWTVSGRTYPLRLKASAISELEVKHFKGKNLLEATISAGVPPVSTMLLIIRFALSPEDAKGADVCALYDAWVDEGGTMEGLFVQVVIPLLAGAGFLSQAQVLAFQQDLTTT